MKDFLPFLLLLAALVGPASASDPACPDGIGAQAGDTPKKTFDLGLGSPLLLCGWSEDKAGLGTTFAEFELVDSRTATPVFRVGALQYTTVVQRGSAVQITEYRNYPLGKDFSYTDAPYRKFEVRKEGQRISLSCSLVMKKPTFTRQQLERLDTMYREAKASRPKSETLGILVVLAAMSGNEKYKNLLGVAPHDLRLDGHYSEEFHATMDDLEELNSGKCRSDFDPRPSNNALHRTPPLRGGSLGPAALGAGERGR